MLDPYLNDSLDQQSLNTFHNDQLSQSKASSTDCYYCQMKRKFNIGQKGNNKCFQHSVAKTNHESGSDPQVESHMSVNEMVDALTDVEDTLNYYWHSMKDQSKDYSQNIQKELEPVYDAFKRVQDKMSKFYLPPSLDISEIEPNYQIRSTKKKYPVTGSQKFFKFQESSLFDPQLSTDCIKEWVGYFHKILHTKTISIEESKELPLQEDLQMRIYKQSMERKFLSFSQQLERNEKKIEQILEKLIFYMEKSEGIVPHEKIHQDIAFIERQEIAKEQTDNSLERMLFLQAASIEFILNNYAE